MTRRVRHCRSGQTAIEYSLIIMVIGIAIVTAVSAMGTQVQAMFAGLHSGFTK